MTQMFVFTAGNPNARQHLRDSIERPVDQKIVFDTFSEHQHEELRMVHDQGNGFYAWGAIPGQFNTPNWEAMEPGNLVLCVYGATYHYVFRLIAKYENERFAETVWKRNEKGKTWQLMYFLTEPVKVDRRLSEFGDYLEPDRYWGFTRIEDWRIREIVASYGSVDRFIAEMLGREGGDLPPQLSVSLERSPKGASRQLKLYEEYSGEEVHDIFAPDTPFIRQRGAWEAHGIVPIPDRPGDFVFFINVGQEQGGHVFDEGITEDGVLTWQSQPHQALHHPQIQQFIAHNYLKNSIYLFLRPKGRDKYTYMGRLKYLSHDTEREKPVYFQWQVLDWSPTGEMLERTGLELRPPAETKDPVALVAENQLEETPPPPRRRRGETTRTFKARKAPDRSGSEERNQDLGRKGELLVVEYEKKDLVEKGRPDLAERVLHVSDVEGDGAGYDIRSFTPEGKTKYIEVKTTPKSASTSFYISPNEVDFSRQHQDNFYLYRVYNYQDSLNSGKFYVETGNVEEKFELTPTQYQAVRS